MVWAEYIECLNGAVNITYFLNSKLGAEITTTFAAAANFHMATKKGQNEKPKQ